NGEWRTADGEEVQLRFTGYLKSLYVLANLRSRLLLHSSVFNTVRRPPFTTHRPMPRDYKHTRRRSSGSGVSGVAGFVVGLALGLSVALAVYLYDRRPAARMAQQTPPVVAEEAAPPPEPAPASQQAETQYDFYEMLPKFEVVIPEQDGRVQAPSGSGPSRVEKPGAYTLQAGSFRNDADADSI